MARGGKISPRLRLAPLTVLSPGPRLAGTPSMGQMKLGKLLSDSAFARHFRQPERPTSPWHSLARIGNFSARLRA